MCRILVVHADRLNVWNIKTHKKLRHHSRRILIALKMNKRLLIRIRWYGYRLQSRSCPRPSYLGPAIVLHLVFNRVSIVVVHLILCSRPSCQAKVCICYKDALAVGGEFMHCVENGDHRVQPASHFHYMSCLLNQYSTLTFYNTTHRTWSCTKCKPIQF